MQYPVSVTVELVVDISTTPWFSIDVSIYSLEVVHSILGFCASLNVTTVPHSNVEGAFNVLIESAVELTIISHVQRCPTTVFEKKEVSMSMADDITEDF